MIEATIETGDVNPFSTRDDFDTKDFKRSMTSMTAEEFEEVINEVLHSEEAFIDQSLILLSRQKLQWA